MNAKHLTNYMKDHFAGSVAAVELLNHLISSHRGRTHEQFFIRLRQEVGEGTRSSAGIVRHDLDAGGGALRNTTAFLSEKLARIKLLLEDPAGTQLAPLEKLEALDLIRNCGHYKSSLKGGGSQELQQSEVTGTKKVHLWLLGTSISVLSTFYRMLLRLNVGAVNRRVNLGELCAKEKDLRGIVDPQ